MTRSRHAWHRVRLLGGMALVSLALLLPGGSVLSAPDVTVGMESGSVEPGGSVTLRLGADVAPPDLLGAFTIEVGYDETFLGDFGLGQFGCVADPAGDFDFGSCNEAFSPGVARCTGVSIAGQIGSGLALCDFTFEANPAASPGTVTPLVVDCLVLTDPGGVPIPCSTQDGAVTIGNEPPECLGAAATTSENTAVTFDLNCSDPDQGPGPLTCDVVTPPPNGDVTITDCSATYTPDAGFTSEDCFGYEAFDGQDTSAPATACVDVTPVGNGIVVRMGSGSVEQNGLITLNLDALNVPAGAIGAFTVDVDYDPTVLEATACTPDPDAVFDFSNCNENFDNDNLPPDLARCTGVSISGVPGIADDVTLCDITFQALGPVGTVTPLSVECAVLTDPSGTPIDCTPEFGQIEIIDPIDPIIVAIGDGAGPPGGTVTVPVTLDVPDGTLVGAATVDAEFDPLLLDAIGCVPDPNGVFDLPLCVENFDDDNLGTDAARCVAIDTTGEGGFLVLCTITFELSPDCVPGTVATVTPSVITLADPPGALLPWTPDPGEITCGLRGDVDCDADIDAVDALFVLQFVIGLKTGADVCPPHPVPPEGPIFLPAADVDQDGDADAVDALFILQCVIGLRDCETWEPIPAAVTTSLAPLSPGGVPGRAFDL